MSLAKTTCFEDISVGNVNGVFDGWKFLRPQVKAYTV